MKYILTILAILFLSGVFSAANISCVVTKTKVFDSTYTRTDSITWKVKRDSAGTDSVRYQKSYVTVSNSPGWLKIKKGTWYLVGAIIALATFWVVKSILN